MSNNNVSPLVPYPALLIEDDSERILVVGDLHIGWEISLTDKGIHIPSQVSRIQTKLLKVIDECKPTQIIFLGDVKHLIPKISLEEWRAVPEFFETILKFVNKVSVTTGNHDGDLEPLTPSTVKILPSSGIIIGNKKRIGLFHGHAWFSPEILSSELLIMSHIHPGLWLRDKIGFGSFLQVWVKAKCDGDKLAKAYLKYLNINVNMRPREAFMNKFGIEIGDMGLIIMPAFNDLVGGLSINKLEKNLMGPILRSGGVKVENAEIYLLDGTYMGMVKQLYNHII